MNPPFGVMPNPQLPPYTTARADRAYLAAREQASQDRRSLDERLLRASHPVRCRETPENILGPLQASIGAQAWARLETDVRAKHHQPTPLVIETALRDHGLSWFLQVLDQSNDSVTSTGGGNTSAIEVALRSAIDPPDHYAIDDDLVALLLEARVADDIPMRFLKIETTRMYIEIGTRRDTGLYVINPVSGKHALEGAYLEIAPADVVAGDHRPTLLVMLTGSPMGHSGPLDDATFSLSLPLWDEAMPLNAALDESIARAKELGRRGGYKPVPDDEWIAARATVGLLAKSLLYINLPSIRRTVVTDRSDALKRLRGMKSGSKMAKLRRQASSLRDCIQIGLPPKDRQGGSEPSGRTVAPHLRRHHFRLQHYGPKNSLSKMILIQDTVVNALGADIAPGPRQFKVTT